VTKIASNVAGANDDVKDLFDFGDKEGVGYQAKLQHPLGVHFCQANSTLYICDTYNHKLKTITGEASSVSSKSELKDWIGVSNDTNPRVLDGQ
jgi:hypothetical protein